jgi:hypothetical protein
MFRGDGERDKVFAALLDAADGLTRRRDDGPRCTTGSRPA